MIIERKTLNDLASSIKDGRYKEQGYRLSNCSLHNHNIFYLIEDNLSSYNSKFNNNNMLSIENISGIIDNIEKYFFYGCI